MKSRRLSAKFKIEFSPARTKPGHVFAKVTLWRKNHYYAIGRNWREAQRLAWQKYINDKKRKPLNTVNSALWKQCAAHPIQRTTCAGCGVEFATRFDYEVHLKIVGTMPAVMGFSPAPEEVVCPVEYARQSKRMRSS